jgi:DNA-binding PadR family transcriptional regulator
MLKYVLLALLARRPRHGYELKSAFEELLGGTWPLNIGQVYVVLSRMEADGLIECEVVPQESVPDRKVYQLTALGKKELDRWVDVPVPGPIRMRDEVFLKVILNQEAGRGDPREFIWSQRQGHLDAMARVSRLRAEPGTAETTALLLDGVMLRLEADLRWLDLCEERLGSPGDGT